MFVLRVILMALRSLRANLLRSLLATLGVIIGVGAVIAANSVIVGGNTKLMAGFDSLGANMIYVSNAIARRSGRAVGVHQNLVAEDVEAIRRGSDHVGAVMPQIRRNGTIKYFSKNDQASIIGTTSDFMQVFNVELSEGSFLERVDVAANRKVAILGYEVARKLFGENSATGKLVKLGTSRTTGFVVGGVMKKKGQKGILNVDEIVVIPITTAQNVISGNKRIDTIAAQAIDSEHLNAMTDDIKRILRYRHRIRRRTGRRFFDFQPDRGPLPNPGNHQAHGPGADHDLRHQPGGRRYWHHEHHARQRDRAHARNRCAYRRRHAARISSVSFSLNQARSACSADPLVSLPATPSRIC